MLKKIKENKAQLITVLLIMAVVVARNLVFLFSKGRPMPTIIALCIGMSVLYVLFFFNRIPVSREELFRGENLVRIIGALVVFAAGFTLNNITHDFCVSVIALAVMIYCASDIRFMPVNVVAAILLTVLRYETVVFNAAPWAIVISFAVTLPKLKGAEGWKKLIFSASAVTTAAMLAYNIYQLRFVLSLSTAKSYLLTTVVMVLFAALFVICAVLSLRSRKASPARKKKKAVEGKKPEYAAAFGYAVAAAASLACTLQESRVVMAGIIGILMSLLVLSENLSQISIFADKAAGALGGLADKVFSASETEK